jgi:phosphopantetheinyl transferase
VNNLELSLHFGQGHILPSAALLDRNPDLSFAALSYNGASLWLCVVSLDFSGMSLPRSARSLLNTDELVRLSSFINEEKAHQFLAGRLLIRHAIASMAGVDPASVDVKQDSFFSKPYSSLASFNISHTDGVLVGVFGRDLDFGIDIEYLCPNVDFAGIAGQYFPAELRDYVLSSPLHRRYFAFYEVWTFLEANAKLDGHGFSMPLRASANSFCCRLTFDSLPCLGCLAIRSMRRSQQVV